jgi:hypothetical protein
VVAFTAQYETIVDGKVYPVIRYDSAHGYPHRDTLDAEGQVVEKFWSSGWGNQEALDHAIADLKANYPAYRAAFIERLAGQ